MCFIVIFFGYNKKNDCVELLQREALCILGCQVAAI